MWRASQPLGGALMARCRGALKSLGKTTFPWSRATYSSKSPLKMFFNVTLHDTQDGVKIYLKNDFNALADTRGAWRAQLDTIDRAALYSTRIGYYVR